MVSQGTDGGIRKTCHESEIACRIQDEMFEALPLEELMQGLPIADPKSASDTDGFDQPASGTNGGSGTKTSPLFVQPLSPLAGTDFQVCQALHILEGNCIMSVVSVA